MLRRNFITLLACAAAARPFRAYAQQGERVRRIGVLTGIGGDDLESKARNAAFAKELQRLGWTEGHNLRIDYRSAGGNAAEGRKYAAELVALGPDVIMAIGTISINHLLQATRTIPIVFTLAVDPVGAAFVESMAEPGGNATGFMMFDYGLAGKWLERLKQVVPGMRRAAVLRDPDLPAGIGQFAVIEAVAPLIGVDVTPISPRDADEMERAVARFARTSNGGLILTAGPTSVVNRDLIIGLAARYQLPAIYFQRLFTSAGGLISYGPNFIDEFRQAASYVDRILRGEKPENLPVQAPTKYELVVNAKTAKALGLTIPPSLMSTADEVIE
jgi:putative ABC transport system substrate-binding protein